MRRPPSPIFSHDAPRVPICRAASSAFGKFLSRASPRSKLTSHPRSPYPVASLCLIPRRRYPLAPPHASSSPRSAMSPQWFCKIADEELGPMTSQQLSQLVRLRRLGPNDLVRKDDSKWVLASRVRGLFPEPSGAAAPPTGTAPTGTAPTGTAPTGTAPTGGAPAVGNKPSDGPSTGSQVTTVTMREVTADWSPSEAAAQAAGTPISSAPTNSASNASTPSLSTPSLSTPSSSSPAQAPSPAAAADLLVPGAVLGNYKILATLGEGGMGVVLKAQHVRMERMVALKVLRGQATESPAAIKRFQQEVRAAARLSHPNIVTAFDADDVNGLHFLVMEYVNGENLADYLSQRGKLDVAQAVDFVMQTAKGLEYAHGEGVVHRDIKPGNLLLDKRGVIKILDMGLASIREPQDASQDQVHADVTQANQLLGTFDYMPPEQAEDPRAVDHRADIYSLGCTLYRLLTGQLPFRGDNPLKKILAHRDQPIPSLRDLRPETPLELERVYKKMLAKKPEDRYQSMGEVLAALQQCLNPKTGDSASISGGLSGGGLSRDGTLRIEAPVDDADEYQLGGGPAKLLGGSPERIVIPASHDAADDDDFGGFQLAPVDGAEERWYWQCMGQEAGPFTLKQLRSKKLTPDDQVRRENGRKWFRAAEIRGLF
ncbi:MAG: protein kinase [Pirellulales bacterium]